MRALAVDTLAAVRASGGDVRIVGPERLKVVAPSPLPHELVDRVRAAKPELLELLSGSANPLPTGTWDDAKEERAAIIEYEGGAPRAWAEALARLDRNKPPCDVPPRRWLCFIDDCGRFLDAGWAERAAAFGWGPLDLFGCDRERPFARVDHLGLLWLVNGGRIIELQRDMAIVETERGAAQTYRRRPVEIGRVVLAWEIIVPPSL
jgi:hypothetical protein